MTIHHAYRGALLGFALAFFALCTPAAANDGASTWSDTPHARTRLIAGFPSDAATWRAGIQIRLDEGFKTYWRTPGSSGVPPTFDFSKSRNLKDAKVLFPAPTSFADGVGNAIGYKGEVILPVVVRPADPALPVDLVLKMDYAVCEKLCIPIQVSASLALTGQAATDRSIVEKLAQFEARVPRRVVAGAQGPLAVVGVERQSEHDFLLTVRTSQGVAPEAFAEGPPGWYYEVSKGERHGDAYSYRVSLVEQPLSDESHKASALLTLVTPDDAIETTLSLPLGPKP